MSGKRNPMFDVVALLAGLCVMMVAVQALAYKVGVRRSWKSTYQNKQIRLVIKGKRWSITGVTLFAGKVATVWKGKYARPKTVLISPKAKRVAFLGGTGDPCMALGRIHVYDFAGKLKKTILLGNHIQKFRAMSKAYTRIAGPCFWLHGKPSVKGATLTLNACNKKAVAVDLKTLKVTVK